MSVGEAFFMGFMSGATAAFLVWAWNHARRNAGRTDEGDDWDGP